MLETLTGHQCVGKGGVAEGRGTLSLCGNVTLDALEAPLDVGAEEGGGTLLEGGEVDGGVALLE